MLSGDDLPGSITIDLYREDAEGNEVPTDEESITVSAETEWKGSFMDLPKYENGEEIVYIVKESAIEGATYDDELEAFFEYDTEANNGKYPVLGQWKVMTLKDYILQNTWTPATEVVSGSTSFSILKVNKNGDALEGAVFELKPAEGDAISKTTDENGAATFDNLDAGTYTLKETTAPDGYKQIAAQSTITITKIKKLNYVKLSELQNMYEFVFSIGATEPAGYTYNAETRTFTVENEPIPYDDITITKIWSDEDNHDGARPTKLKITLLADGEEDDEVTLTSENATEDDDNTWTYTFEHKPTTTVAGATIAYTIAEDETVLGDYEPSYDEEEDPLTITNSYTPKTTFISGSKTWQYNGIDENFRPTTIKVGLYDDQKNKVDEDTVSVDEDGNWSYFFYDLPVYRNEEGVVSRIVYSVKELEVEGTTYDEDSDAFYKYDTETNNGKNAVLGKWTVQTLEDYILQNTWTPATETVSGTTSLKVVKIDAETKEELQGAVFTLKADDGTETSLTTNENGEATAENLDAGVYTITEVTAPDKHILLSSSSTITITKIKKLTDVNLSSLINTYVYEFTATATDAEGYTFDADTNTFTVENEAITYDDITVHKVWNDDSNRDGHRLDSVTLILVGSDGKEYEATLTKTQHANKDDSNTWDYTFENIPLVTIEGEDITYTISEDEEAIGDYEPSYDQETLTVTNTLEPELIDILGYKVWQDGDNISGLRPTSLEFKLLDGDRNEVDSTIIFEDENGDWYFGFYDLPRWQNIDGEVSEIEYEVKEVVDLNYTVSYSEDEDGLIVVTNTLKGHGGNPEPPETGRNTNAEMTSAKVTYSFGYVSIVLFAIIAFVFSRSKANRK